MKITVNQYGQLLEEIIALPSAESQDEALKKLAKVILRNKDQKKFFKIAAAWEKIAQKKAGIVKGEIVWAGDSSQEKEEWVKRIIEEKEQQLGKKIALTVEKDEKLLGGLKLKIGDLVWDASWRKKIFQLSEQLKNGE